MKTSDEADGLTPGATYGDDRAPGRLIVLRGPGETAGELIELEAVCEPGPPGVEERSFEAHDVSFELLEGRLQIGIRGETRTLLAGCELRLEAGTPHRIWVEGGAAARFIWRMEPAAAGDPVELVFGQRERAVRLEGGGF